MAEHIILLAGPMGAGKTTAIRSLSEIEVVSTEAANSDRETVDKETTTVALDYGEITIGDEDKVRLYGLPGQKRFDFMWQILRERAVGLLLLIKGDAPDALEQTENFLVEFGDMHSRGGIVIGLTHLDQPGCPSVAEFADRVQRVKDNALIPIFTVDARDGFQMQTCLVSLVANVEMFAMLHGKEEEVA